VNIAFRVNASNSIGTGHLYRCLELAKYLKDTKNNIYFICDKINLGLIKKINDLKVNLHIIKEKRIDKNYEKIDSDQTITIFQKINKKINLLIVDSYLLGFKWERKLKQHVDKIFVIDDLDRKHACDLYLNQNFFSKNKKKFLEEKTIKLIGLKYCILKFNKFEKKRIITNPKKIENVLMFMGGSDRSNLTIKILKIFGDKIFNQLKFDVVIGINNKKIKLIKKLTKKRKNINIHFDLPNLKKLLLKSDIAISSGGSFIWECIFFGVPSLIINQSKNQIHNSKMLNNISAIKLYKNKLNNLTKLRGFFGRYILKKNFIVPKYLYNLIDGNGKLRIIKFIKKINEN
jgi:UDP-2,4-diacetamido-2,4,6-trideoxy-beta-L-altropyranose hydrolase